MPKDRRPPSPPAEGEGPLGHARIATILIFARDFPRMLAFYRDTLGLRAGFTSEEFAELSAGGGASIALHSSREGARATDGDLMIEFIVPDIELTVRNLRGRGVAVDPIRSESFGRITGFLDPEGHRIGLEQPRRPAA